METLTETNRIRLLQELGFSLESGRPMGDVESDWPHISYAITLSFNGRPVIVTSYRLGVGHVNIKKARVGFTLTSWDRDEESMIYSWQKHPFAKFKNKELQARVAAKLAIQQKVAPKLDEVLHSLMSDGEAFFDAKTFEEWADDLGYDKDSIKAEAIYRACDTTGRKLATVIPKDVLNQAREITKDI